MRKLFRMGILILLSYPLTAAQDHSPTLKPSVQKIADHEPLKQIETEAATICEALHRHSEQFKKKYFEYKVRRGNSLFKIAANHKLAEGIIKCLNPALEAIDRLYPGQKLHLPKSPPYVVIDSHTNTLTVYIDTDAIKGYPVATGMAGKNEIPIGQFRITKILWNPYDYKNSAPAGHPNNEFGSVWISLNIPQYGIHGTNDPGSIGKYASKGCIRMLNADINEVAKVVRVDGRVQIK